MSDNVQTSGGIGFVGLLTIVFIVLKLTGNITWSWWWVLSPIWISVLFTLFIIGIILLVAFSIFMTSEDITFKELWGEIKEEVKK